MLGDRRSRSGSSALNVVAIAPFGQVRRRFEGCIPADTIVRDPFSRAIDFPR